MANTGCATSTLSYAILAQVQRTRRVAVWAATRDSLAAAPYSATENSWGEVALEDVCSVMFAGGICRSARFRRYGDHSPGSRLTHNTFTYGTYHFLSAAQGEERVVLLVVGGGPFLSHPCRVFCGVKRQKLCLKTGMKKQKLCLKGDVKKKNVLKFVGQSHF